LWLAISNSGVGDNDTLAQIRRGGFQLVPIEVTSVATEGRPTLPTAMTLRAGSVDRVGYPLPWEKSCVSEGPASFRIKRTMSAV